MGSLVWWGGHLAPTVQLGPGKKLYISLIRSQMMYGSQLWRPMLIKDVSNLERLQRRATKFILQNYVSDYKSRLLSLNLLALMMLYELNDIMLTSKIHPSPLMFWNLCRSTPLTQGHTRPLNNFHRNQSDSATLERYDLSLATLRIRTYGPLFNPISYQVTCAAILKSNFKYLCESYH